MKELLVVPMRTSNQLLRRLVKHFMGDPISQGHYLYYVANGLPKAKDDDEIYLLARPGSIWIEHVILVDSNQKVLVDNNSFIDAKLIIDGEKTIYEAVKPGGKIVRLVPFKRITVEQFIKDSELHFTLKHMRNTDG